MGFLAAVLVLAWLCDEEGLFTAAGGLVARLCRGRPQRLLTGVFAMAALVTAVLSLDATVVLLTPVVFGTAARVRARPRPHVYACTHLANSASLLLPVSNLTNLTSFAGLNPAWAALAGALILAAARAHAAAGHARRPGSAHSRPCCGGGSCTNATTYRHSATSPVSVS